MLKYQSLILSAHKAINDCLNNVPFVNVFRSETSPTDSGPDYILHIDTPLGRKAICAEISANGQPRFARILIDKVRLLSDDSKTYWIFVAPFISEKTGKMLRSSGIGFVDLAGNCFISFGGLHIQKEGKKNPYLSRRQFNSLFKVKASRVLRVLLSDPSLYWKIAPLAKEAHVSVGHAYNVKEELLNREWAVVDNRGMKLSEPEILLQEWCSNYQLEDYRRVSFYSLLETSRLEKHLEESCSALGVRYALSGFAGAARLAPFVRYHRVHCYVENNVNDLVKSLDLKLVTSGENVILINPPDDGVFYDTRRVDGVWLVSPIQVYLDLKVSSDRGEEAADFIYKEVIEPQWKRTKLHVTARE
jgi:hypothetical protein